LIGIRSGFAAAIPVLTVLAFLAFGLYGMYLEEKVERLRGIGQEISKENRWNPALYPPGSEKWLSRDQAWHRLRIPVWLAIIVTANILYFLIRPR
jgi:hypothetical protein